MAWLATRLCVHMLCIYPYPFGLARAPPMCAYAMHVYSLYGLARASLVCAYASHVYLLSWLCLYLANVCICYACLPRSWLGSCFVCVGMCYACLLTFIALLAPCLNAYMLCMYPYACGLARVSPVVCICYACLLALMAWLASRLLCAYAMHAYLLRWLGSPLAEGCICYACLLTLMAWLVPCLCAHMLFMFDHAHGLACTSPLSTHPHGLARTSPIYLCLWCALMTLTLLWRCALTFTLALCLACVCIAMCFRFFSLLGLCRANVCLCHARVLTALAWLVPR